MHGDSNRPRGRRSGEHVFHLCFIGDVCCYELRSTTQRLRYRESIRGSKIGDDNLCA
jgi:hypothetical protein